MSSGLRRRSLVGNCARLVLALIMLAAMVEAQDLDARAYSPLPTGTNIVAVAFVHSSGSVIADATVPLTDVHASINSFGIGLGHSFGLLGRQAVASVAVPYALGEVDGKVGDQLQQASITRSGLGDLRIRLSLNLHGSPALSPPEFAKLRRQGVIVGTSLTIQAPSGQYDPAKLVNLGANRWAFKPEVGLSYPIKKIDLDLYAGATFFTQNPRFFPRDIVREQDLLASIQAHVIYTFRPRLWLAFDTTWYGGGASHLNGGFPTGRYSNSRVGITFGLPIKKSQSLKFLFSTAATGSAGTSFTSVGVLWQFLWFDRVHKREP